MIATRAGRRALAAVGLAVGTIVVTGAPAGAIELPPASIPEVTVPSLPPLDVPVLDVPVSVPALVVTAPQPTFATTTAPPVPVTAVPITQPPPTVPVPPRARVATPHPAAPVPVVPAPALEPAVRTGVVASPPLRTVASERARAFAFPFTLALLVVAFLVVHGRLAAGDPRLAGAPVDDDRREFR